MITPEDLRELERRERERDAEAARREKIEAPNDGDLARIERRLARIEMLLAEIAKGLGVSLA